MRAEPVITGIGVVSPRGRTPAAAATAPEVAGPWFDHRAELGRHGYKYFPPACHYLLAAARAATADAGGPPRDLPAAARAAAVGTDNGGSARQAELDRTIVESGAERLGPMDATFFSINVLTGQLAIEHELTGFTLTFTTPRVAGLEALAFGAAAMRRGRAGWLLAGATESSLDPAEPGAAHSEEGAVVLVAEPAERARARGVRGYGRCAVRTGFLPPAEVSRTAVRAALRALGASGTGLPVFAVLDESRLGDTVAAVLGAGAERVPAAPGCLEPVLRLSWCLAAGPPRSMLVTAAATGNIAVTVIERAV